MSITGCAVLGRGSASTLTTCFPGKCVLEVQNDDGRSIVVRYSDSTGVGDILGLVPGSGLRVFPLPRRTRRIVIVEARVDGHLFRAITRAGPPPRDVSPLHFPSDFDPVSVQKPDVARGAGRRPSPGMAPTPGDSVDAQHVADAAVVQIRAYWQSSIVSVFAWLPDEPLYGLRASLRRDGSLVRDHQLYVSTAYHGTDAGLSTVARARSRVFETIAPAGLLLKSTGISRDNYHCYFGWPDHCTPLETRGVRLPDALLRTNRDSVVVAFPGRAGTDMVVSVHRDLIDAYLAAVDSVSGMLRKK